MVTGASRGIGRAVALGLAREGVDVAIVSRHREAIEEAAAAIAAETGRRVWPFVADLADGPATEAFMTAAVEALGGLDILVNNGARVSGSEPEDFEDVTEALIRRDFEEKVLGYLRCARLAVPWMKRGGFGRIVNISGYAARTAGPISAGIRNAAVVHLTRSLAFAVGRDNITVNAVYPSVTVTETLTERLAARAAREGRSVDAVLAEEVARHALGRLVRAEEIADVVVFLASPRASGITGEVIPVAGGAERAVRY